ncbi:reticulocyte-binding protein 2-like [Leptopilina heterotoma]|uniref:reticulocyte-binding protein 2-like n=1 Tax=Leptopilina heterotoma TaxID=63436 RepID=UPI001CA82AEA|nr:reticulocyte-binding protein 2-like [Leptopilina heterotoma]
MSPRRKGKIEAEGKTQMEIIPKAKNHLCHEIEDNSKNLKSGRNESKTISKINSSMEKSNPIVSSLKLMNKDSNSEKLTRSSTIILPGNCSSSRQFSNSSRGRNNCNTQPIWKPAGNVNVTLPGRPISRQNTRLITSSLNKKRDEKTDDVSLRNPTSSRSNDPKKLPISHKIQRSSSSMGAYDLRKKSDNSSPKIEQKSMSARLENKKSNLIANSIESGESLTNKNSARAKWKTRQPEVIQMLKELIKNNSEEEKKISTNNSKNSLKLKKIDNSLLNLKAENSQSKLSIKNKGDSKSGIAITRNMSEDKIDDNSSKTKLNHKKYLRKNASDSSYLESYIKLNSRQNHPTNSRKSLSEKIKSKNSSQVEIKDKKEEGKIDDNRLEKTNNSKSLFNFQDCNNSQSTCELGTKISSSKSCQVSFETSSCSRNSDPVLDTETNSFESDNQCSETFIEKSDQFVDKSKKSFYLLKEILEKYGFNVDLVDNTERKSNLTENGSFSSILLDKESGAIVAVCSSQTLFDKLTSLSDSDLEIKNIMNHFSLESIDNESQVRKIERKKNLEILQITDKMENNLRISFSKHKNRSEEIFSINCVESCGKIDEEKKIQKPLSGIEEKFSFVNLILKEESERKINNFVNEKKNEEKLLEIENQSLENCQKEENEEDGFIFDNLVKEEENCEEVNIPCEGERNVNTVNGKNEEEKESILIDINLNDKTEFSTNTNSYEISPSDII